MKIAIVGSMLNELWTLKHEMSIQQEECIADRHYYQGILYDHPIVLVYAKCGKVASAITAMTLILKYKVDFILFIGVAGALTKELKQGDIVIADELFQYDMDARPIFPLYEIPFTSKAVFKPKISDIDKAKLACNYFINHINDYISSDTLKKYSLDKTKICVGKVATGDQFVTDISKFKSFFAMQEIPLAIEMEGAAIAQVCEEHNLPYLVIRIISDMADEVAANDYQNFVTEIASYYAAGILKAFFSANSF